MDDIFLFLGVSFVLTFILGMLIERIRIPWIFGALILGSFLAFNNPFTAITSSETFNFLSQMGIYFLLFMIGLELDFEELKTMKSFIVKSTFFIVLLEALIIGAFIYFVFNYSLLISFLVSMSFATVGESMLIPILDEFKIVNTKLGQAIIGIGTFDDVIEIFTLFILIPVVGYSAAGIDPLILFLSLALLVAVTLLMVKYKKYGKIVNKLKPEMLLLISLCMLFIFVGIGNLDDAGPLAALLAGIGLGSFLPKKRDHKLLWYVRAACYGLFAPVFFLTVGLTMDINYLFSYPLYVLFIVALATAAKLAGSYIMSKDLFSPKESVLMGIGLSVRFSTSIIIIKILLDTGAIGLDIYSVVVASSIIFKFIIPVAFSNLIVRWKIAEPKLKRR